MTSWFILVLSLFSFATQDPPLSPKLLSVAIAAKPRGAEAEKLAEKIRGYFDKEDLLKGARAKIDEFAVVWAIEAPNAKAEPRVVSDDAKFVLPLSRIGSTDLYC